MKMTVILIVVGTLGTVSEGLEKKLDKQEIIRRIETILTTALFKPGRIIR